MGMGMGMKTKATAQPPNPPPKKRIKKLNSTDNKENSEENHLVPPDDERPIQEVIILPTTPISFFELPEPEQELKPRFTQLVLALKNQLTEEEMK